MQYAICRYFGHKHDKIVSISLNFRDIKFRQHRWIRLEKLLQNKQFFLTIQKKIKNCYAFSRWPPRQCFFQTNQVEKRLLPRAMQNFKPIGPGVIALTDPIHMQYAICRYFGHKIVSISLNFRDIKISIAPLDSPSKTAVQQNKNKVKSRATNGRVANMHLWYRSRDLEIQVKVTHIRTYARAISKQPVHQI